MKGGVPCRGLNWADATSGVLYNVVTESDHNIETVTKWLNERKECGNYNKIITKFTDSKFTKAVRYIYSGESEYYIALVSLLITELSRCGLNQERVNFYNKRKEFESGNTQTERTKPDSKRGWTEIDKTRLDTINDEEEKFKNEFQSGSLGTTYGDRDSTTGLNPSFSQIPE